MAFNAQELFKQAQERAAKTTGMWMPDTDSDGKSVRRKVGDSMGGLVIEVGTIETRFGVAPVTVLEPLDPAFRVLNPADPGTDKNPNYADLTSLAWIGTVLESAYYRLQPEPGDVVMIQVTGHRQSRKRPDDDPYTDWNVVVYDGNTGKPKLPAAMRAGVNPNTGEKTTTVRPGPGQERFEPWPDDEDTPTT